jgi:hypothetical protein
MSTLHKFIIIKDRVEIYRDFTVNLINYIIDFYLDKNTLSDDDDIRNHFNWCFNKVCDEFNEEGLDFSKKDVLRQYFYNFFYYQFYKRENQNIDIKYYEKFWGDIFEIDKRKNKNIMNMMV